jgi:hypothetical protein
MTETTATPEYDEKKMVQEVNIQLGILVEKEIREFTIRLDPEVKIVERDKAISIKRKNKNFVYMTKGKRIPLTVSVRENKAWKKVVLNPENGFETVKEAIANAYNEITGK